MLWSQKYMYIYTLNRSFRKRMSELKTWGVFNKTEEEKTKLKKE